MCRGGTVCPLSAEENHSGKGTTAVKPGVLNGRYRVTFTNVTTLRLSATVRRPY